MDETFDPVAYINTPRFAQWNFGLGRIEALLEKLGRPQDSLSFVHVAGTNGKGSTCAYIASVLQQAGYKTGLFTSPYIETFEERIRVNGRNIPLEALREITLSVRAAALEVEQELGDHPTEFELMTAVAMLYFKQLTCDIVVLEVGLGGRLDSTNVIDAAEVSVITRIGLDHTNVLGETLHEIAAEKAGIIKPHGTVVAYPQEPEAQEVIEHILACEEATCTEPDFEQLESEGIRCSEEGTWEQVFRYKGVQYTTQLLGSYQPCNAALALEVIGQLQQKGWEISKDALERGIACAVWPGRFEILPSGEGQPVVVLDGGHNPQGAQALRASLDRVFPDKPVVFIMGGLADKNLANMAAAVESRAKAFITTNVASPRALSADDLALLIRGVIELAAAETSEATPVVTATETFTEAFNLAYELAAPEDVICSFGSLYGISAARKAAKRSL